MILKVLFGSEPRYESKSVLKAIAAVTEDEYKIYPRYIYDMLAENRDLEQYESIAIVDINVDESEINKILFPQNKVVEGEVIKDEKL